MDGKNAKSQSPRGKDLTDAGIYGRSAEKISAAFFALLAVMPYGDITVTAICEKAGVARKTFYRNFETKAAVAERRLDAMFSALTDKFDFLVSKTSDLLKFCFSYLNADREFARLFNEPELSVLIENKITEYVEIACAATLSGCESCAPSLGAYYNNFIAVGLVSIVRNWAANGFNQSTESVTALTARLLSGVLR